MFSCLSLLPNSLLASCCSNYYYLCSIQRYPERNHNHGPQSSSSLCRQPRKHNWTHSGRLVLFWLSSLFLLILLRTSTYSSTLQRISESRLLVLSCPMEYCVMHFYINAGKKSVGSRSRSRGSSKKNDDQKNSQVQKNTIIDVYHLPFLF